MTPATSAIPERRVITNGPALPCVRQPRHIPQSATTSDTIINGQRNGSARRMLRPIAASPATMKGTPRQQSAANTAASGPATSAIFCTLVVTQPRGRKSLCVLRSAQLHHSRRTLVVTVGTKDATIAGKRPKDRLAVRALEEIHARVVGHGSRRFLAAMRTRNFSLTWHRKRSVTLLCREVSQGRSIA